MKLKVITQKFEYRFTQTQLLRKQVGARQGIHF